MPLYRPLSTGTRDRRGSPRARGSRSSGPSCLIPGPESESARWLQKGSIKRCSEAKLLKLGKTQYTRSRRERRQILEIVNVSNLPKLEAAGSNPVSRSIVFSVPYMWPAANLIPVWALLMEPNGAASNKCFVYVDLQFRNASEHSRPLPPFCSAGEKLISHDPTGPQARTDRSLTCSAMRTRNITIAHRRTRYSSHRNIG